MRAQAAGIAAHRRKARSTSSACMGLPVTSPAQTFFDLAHVPRSRRSRRPRRLPRAAKRFTPEQLVAFAEKHRGPYSGWPGERRGWCAPAWTRRWRHALRLLIVFAGLPEPEVDHRVHDEDGNLLRRYDLSYLSFRLIIEYDGRQHAESEEQWLTDIGRDEQLDDELIRRLVIVSRDIYRTPARHARAGSRAPCARRVCRCRRLRTSGAATSRSTRATSSCRPDRARQLSPGATAGRETPEPARQPSRAQLRGVPEERPTCRARPRRRATRAERAGDGARRTRAAGTSRHTQGARHAARLSVRSRRTEAEPEPITLRMGNRTRMPRVGRGVLVHSGHG